METLFPCRVGYVELQFILGGYLDHLHGLLQIWTKDWEEKAEAYNVLARLCDLAE